MQRHHTVVGPCAPDDDIILATTENYYRGKLPGVPDTPFLLIVQVTDSDDFTWLTRVVGIDQNAVDRLGEGGVPYIVTDARMEARFREYFEISWAQQQQCFTVDLGVIVLS